LCELKKSFLSPTLGRTQLLEVFIYRNVASWGVHQGVSRFVNGGPRMLSSEYHTRAAAVRPAGLGLYSCFRTTLHNFE
jgi:hypothetical protein